MLRVAAIGLRIHGHGGIAEVLAAGDAALVAIAEEDEERRDQASARYDVPTYADWRQMLDNESPGLVVACPPHDQKAAVALACLERGVHVLVDKPMALTHGDLDRLEQVIAHGPGQVQMMLTERFNPVFVALKRLVDSGRLGAIAGCVAMRPHEFSVVRSEPWMWERQREGGIFLDLMIHDIDLVRWVTGAEVVSVQASQAQKRFTHPGFYDIGQALFRLNSGAAANLEADWLVPRGAPWDCRFFIIGSEGTAEVATLDRAGLWYWTAGQERQRVLVSTPSPASSGADLVARVRGDGPTVLSAADAVAATRAAIYARDAADTETPVIVGSMTGE